MSGLGEVALGNTCVSLGLAVAAWLVQTRAGRPALAHLLWLLALVKLLTPSVFQLPLIELPDAALAAPSAAVEVDPLPLAADASPALDDREDAILPPAAEPDEAEASLPLGEGLLALWLVGSAIVLSVSLLRVLSFHRLLRAASIDATPAVQELAHGVARPLGLRRTPRVRLSTARLSPMVWGLGRRATVYLPESLLAELSERQLRWILAHELAHVRRRDHWVRWLEWLVCVGCWWNPVAWWARRNLRVNEEVCCDALVLRTLRPHPKNYAGALLSAVEHLATPALRPPAVASQIDSGGFLERRLRMIVSPQPWKNTPRWLYAAVLGGAAALLPLGVAQAADDQDDEVRAKLARAVKDGDLSRSDAEAKLTAYALKRFAQQLEQGVRDEDAARDKKLEAARRKVEAAREKIDAAVEAGHLAADEAREKRAAVERELSAVRRAKKDPREGLSLQLSTRSSSDEEQAARAKAQAARVEAEMARHTAELERKMAEVEKKLRELAASGQLDKAEARAKMDQVQEKIRHAHDEAMKKRDQALEEMRRARVEKLRPERKARPDRADEAAERKVEAERRRAELKERSDRQRIERKAQADKMKAERKARSKELKAQRDARNEERKLRHDERRVERDRDQERERDRDVRAQRSDRRAEAEAVERAAQERERKYLEVEAKLMKAVDAGQVSKEEALKKLAEVKLKLFGGDR